MQINEVMSRDLKLMPSNASIGSAAQKMRDSDCGAMPVYTEDKLVGMVTDRDLTIRALADGVRSNDPVSSIASKQVLYCFEDDDVNDVLKNMQENRVQRLIVLNNREEKKLSGIVSLADIADKCEDEDSLRAIADCCRHYH